MPRGGPGAAGVRPSLQLSFKTGPHQLRVGARLREQSRDQALGLVEEGEQEVLTVYLGVPVPERFGLSVLQCFLGLLG